MNRRVAILLTLGALVLAGLGLWIRFRSEDGQDLLDLLGHIREPAEERLELKLARFADLPGWGEDALSAALPALLRSCGRIAKLPDESPVAPRQEGMGFAGTAADWKPACAAAAGVPAGDDAAARAFFERWFRPMAATNNGHPLGLFTGYYEPLLHGSRTRGGRFIVPLYLRPPELVTVDLGDFRESLKGQRIAGKVEDGALVPFPDREAIEEGALAGRRLELVWVDDPVDAFFLHVQGSGRVRLAEGGEMRVGYAAQNGHPYFAIGRDLIERGALSAKEVSMQSIRAWLAAHPDEAAAVMAKNASYVFFTELEGDGPLGAEGVALTPGRSLAVDLKFMPMGMPVWLSGGMPGAREGEPDRKLRRLLVAQDTGGAIRGPVRGDVFWGHGDAGDVAAEIAGRMKHRGRLWVLLPVRPPSSAAPASEPRAPSARPPGPAPAPPG